MSVIKIFLAEGQNHVRQAIHLTLDNHTGIQVTGTACHAEGLLAQIPQQPPDVLLLDWMLPGMNPQRMLPVVRQFCPRTRIIATVLQASVGRMALAYGVDSFILKSLAPDEFSESLLRELTLE